MSHAFADEFCWFNWSEIDGEEGASLADAEKYNRIVTWASNARRRNPTVFDALTAWIRDDSEWGDEQLADNEQLLMHDVIARFREQTARLRTCLRALEPSGVVNAPVFATLDRFDDELHGRPYDEKLRDTVAQVFANFATMRARDVREKIAGGITGPAGVDSVDFFGYINHLKSCDAEIQWTLFMPAMVERQQRGFEVASFEYMTLPAMRFIGREDEGLVDRDVREELFSVLDAMSAHASGFDHDVLLLHHDGLGVDVGPWHNVWGRFLAADAPVLPGFTSIDFVPESDSEVGPPYVSQLALATFSGDIDAMHQREGYDVNAMYDVTRNILLGQGVVIPYPDKYWAAEVFPNGANNSSTAYMFGVILAVSQGE